MNKKTIEKIRMRLEKERNELLRHIKNIEERERQTLNDHVGDDIDKATADAQREILFSLNDVDRGKLDQVEDALQKIQENRYGICETCGKKIKNARLEALPYARDCIKCES